jgi:hypothetical protein
MPSDEPDDLTVLIHAAIKIAEAERRKTLVYLLQFAAIEARRGPDATSEAEDSK